MLIMMHIVRVSFKHFILFEGNNKFGAKHGTITNDHLHSFRVFTVVCVAVV